MGIGLFGGTLLDVARRKESMTKLFRQIGIAALPLLCFVLSEMLDASMFIAAFVAGLAVQINFTKDHNQNFDFAKKWGKLLNLSVFFLFGLLVARDLHLLDATSALYAVLSLTFVRMLPVAIALAGAHLNKPTVLFLGWFGPRGLASIVLGLIYLAHEVRLSGRINNPTCGDDYCSCQHLRPRVERCAWDQPLRAPRCSTTRREARNRSSPSRISD